MKALRLPDVSLYELASQCEQPPQPLQISPTTFKSIVGLFLDFLIKQELPATLWLKLPRGEVWQAEVDRFCQSATAPFSLYSLQTYAKPETPPVPLNAASERTTDVQTTAASDLLAWQDPDASELPDLSVDDAAFHDSNNLTSAVVEGSRIWTLPLAAESQLKREYFLLVTSPQFQGLVLAHRPRSSRAVKADTVKADAKLPLAEESLERKHPLLGVCSFDPTVMRSVLEAGINRAICFGQPDTQASDVMQDLLLSWEDLQRQHRIIAQDPVLLGELLTQQLQRQEDLWRSSAMYRRQAEAVDSLQQENAELLQALRLRDDFIKTLGQELRTPLTSMKTALSLLNSSNLRPQQRQRYMEMLSQECDRQSSVITGVLDLVQLEGSEPLPMEALRLSDIVPGVVSTYQPLAQEKGVMLAYTVAEDLPPVACLAPWLRQIVINLLHNGIKFTPSGGQVWVRARAQGDVVQLEFRDTGIGIAPSDIPRIFDRFYRVRSGTGNDPAGVGLGLAMVQQLLLRCGGSISVKSKPGEGSIFSVLLPVYSSE
ncbi:MAG: histidine kinase [Synechococcales cyanobacterium C42_A2020_086]|jgi:signal transduction histidine kinase|nr:histidine kinase [Synechococcales cyanobacterium C42_A2020_086]